MNIFVPSFDVDGLIHPAVTRLVHHGVLDAPRTHSRRSTFHTSTDQIESVVACFCNTSPSPDTQKLQVSSYRKLLEKPNLPKSRETGLSECGNLRHSQDSD